MSKKNLIIHMEGGFGNQLFQYFFGKSYAKKFNRNLYFDNKTGFISDITYKRKFELPIIDSRLLKSYIFFFICFRLIRKIFKINKIKLFNSIFVSEKKIVNNNFFFEKYSNIKNIFVIGNFQNEKYFENSKKEILKTLKFNEDKSFNFFKKYNSLDIENTVALGIRVFEEAPTKDLNKLGGIESIDFYTNSINFFKKKLNDPTFVIFSTTKNQYIENLNISKDKFIHISNSNTSFSAQEKIILMSKFKYFIISNSTFYWWAAYISEINNGKIDIISSKNFVNHETVPTRWKKI